MTPDDLTESALRTVLFGEPDPLAGQHMGFATEIDDPLRPLRQSPFQRKSFDRFRSCCSLTFSSARDAPEVFATFRLGVAIRGRRSLALAWEPLSRFSNESVTVRSISGQVNI